MHIYDLAIMIPLGYLALLSGVLLSARTNWGLLKHWWIVTKLVLTVAVLVTRLKFVSLYRLDTLLKEQWCGGRA